MNLKNIVEILSEAQADELIKLLISEIKKIKETKIEDIAFLCANCHKAIHNMMKLKKRLITIEEMRNNLKK